MQLRPYQEECIRAIEARPPGAYLIQMATGLGKTVTFAHIPRRGRMLILSHREELVKQPLKYFDCPAGVEMAQETAPRNAEVVSASVQSLARRLDRFGRGLRTGGTGRSHGRDSRRDRPGLSGTG